MDDYYCVEEYSDNEVIDSSDDEDFKSLFTCIENEDEEDFETEMERERQSHVNGVHKPVENSRPDQTGPNSEEPDSDDNTAKNDQLLYDPNSDENDQKWVDSQRPKRSATSGGQSGSSMRSDATLNCPACLALLCRDCQRHDIYRTQYRAMFVLNCRTDFTETLQYKQKGRKRFRGSDSTAVDNYHPVFCEQCNTQVAVYDTDEVYHFFGVLASF